MRAIALYPRSENKGCHTYMGVIDVLSVGAAIAALIVSVYTYLQTRVHDRRRDTLDAYNVLQEQALDPLQEYTPSRIKEIAEDPRCREYKAISKYLARIEHFCVGVEHKIYDRKIVYALSKGYLNRGVYNKLKPLIDKKNRMGRYYQSYIAVVEQMNQSQSDEK